MKKIILIVGLLLLFTGSAIATPLSLNMGSKILLVDGNDDSNVSVSLASMDVWDNYYLRYSVNDGAWTDVTDWGYDSFVGGDILDFALVGSGGSSEFYVLSDDADDNTFSASMFFVGELEASESQQPVMDRPYFKDLFITWNIDSYGTTWSNTFTLTGWGEGTNDGVAPAVPEPSTLLLLGSGLVGLAYLKRRKA